MPESKIKPEMLLLARTARGMSQKDLGDSLGVSQGLVWRMETESRHVNPALLQSLSTTLDFPQEFFFEDWNIFPVRAPHYRKRAALSARTREMIEAIANIRRMHIHKLLRGYELQTNFTPLDLDDYENSPEKIAQAVRHYWKMPRGPVKPLTRLIEAAGIIVLKCDFGTNLLDGFTIADNFNPPIIYINKDMPGDRQRFTLAHELGHIIMHSIATENMEKEANLFAGEFLMPEMDVKADLLDLSLQKLAILKKKWMVSMAALLQRAKHLFGLAFTNQYDYLVKKMSMLGYKTREPAELDVPFEQPALMNKLISMYTEQGISKSQLAKSIFATERFFSELYDEPVDYFAKARLA